LEQNNRIFESIIQSVNHHLETIEKAVWGCNKKDVDFETVDKFLKEVDSLNKSDKS
jgi:late competence protein required for DNA uptake (superfamily II DNA/RNA helicase)